jgi:hypothetical protein
MQKVIVFFFLLPKFKHSGSNPTIVVLGVFFFWRVTEKEKARGNEAKPCSSCPAELKAL